MKNSAVQLSLFDDFGVPPFIFGSEGSPSMIPVADFHVAGMDFNMTHDGDHEVVLAAVLEGLGYLQSQDLKHRQLWLNGKGWLDIRTWEMSIYATVRSEQSNGIVQVNQRGCTVEVSLPHPDLWSAHGLDWLRHFQNCCDRNRANPTPWFGPCCGCMPA